MSSVQRNAKIYGAVETESFITFQGFCKKIYDATQQEVEVFIDDKKIDTLLANEKIPKIEDTYEVFDTEGFCFTYKLPKEYIGKKHKLEFKTLDEEQLVHSPFNTIDVKNEKYNEYCFFESLKEPIDGDKIKDLYCSNSIGFFATKENIEDGEFVNYIKDLMLKFDNTNFKIFCLDKNKYHKIENTFGTLNNKLKLIIPDNIYMIANEIEVFICNYNNINSVLDYELKSFEILRQYCPKILSKYSNLEIPNFKTLSIEEFEVYLRIPLKQFMDNSELLGFLPEELLNKDSFVKSFQRAIARRFNLGELEIDYKSSAHEYFNFILIEYALSNTYFKSFYYDTVMNQIKILYGNN